MCGVIVHFDVCVIGGACGRDYCRISWTGGWNHCDRDGREAAVWSLAFETGKNVNAFCFT